MTKKILLISNLYPSKDFPAYGTFVKTIHDNYLALGYEVELVALKKAKTASKLITYLSFYRQVSRALKESTADIINIHYPSHVAPAVLPYLNQISPRLLTTLHGGDAIPKTKAQRLMNPLTKRILKGSRLLVTSSDSYKELILSRYGLITPIVSCPPGGINPQLFYPKSSDGLTSHEPTIGFVGRIIKAKGVFDLIGAFMQLSHKARLRIVGTGNDLDELRVLIKEKKLDRVELLGSLPHDQLGDFYRGLDVLAFPSHLQESFGLVVLEAMACAVPVIASHIAAMKPIIQPDHNGWFVEVGQTEQLQDKLTKFLALPDEEKERMRQAAIQTAEPYLIDKVREQTKRLIDDF